MRWAAVQPPTSSQPDLPPVIFSLAAARAGFEPIDLALVNATKLVYVVVDDKPHIMNVATGVRCPRHPSPPLIPQQVTAAAAGARQGSVREHTQWHGRVASAAAAARALNRNG
jgi:hypothetical protein